MKLTETQLDALPYGAEVKDSLRLWWRKTVIGWEQVGRDGASIDSASSIFSTTELSSTRRWIKPRKLTIHGLARLPSGTTVVDQNGQVWHKEPFHPCIDGGTWATGAPLYKGTRGQALLNEGCKLKVIIPPMDLDAQQSERLTPQDLMDMPLGSKVTDKYGARWTKKLLHTGEADLVLEEWHAPAGKSEHEFKVLYSTDLRDRLQPDEPDEPDSDTPEELEEWEVELLGLNDPKPEPAEAAPVHIGVDLATESFLIRDNNGTVFKTLGKEGAMVLSLPVSGPPTPPFEVLGVIVD